jgi:hypothetical protein
MKTKLLFSVLFTLSLTAFSQTLDSENFNSLTLGNFGEDLTGATAGQGGFSIFGNNGADPTTTTNSATSNYQVVASGNDGSQGAQITSPNGDAGIRFLFKSIADEWTGRTSGNDIAELEFDFFTGSTTSLALFRTFIFGTNAGAGTNIVGIQFDPATNVLRGLASLINGGAQGFFGFNLGPDNTPLVLPADTWFTIGCSYNSVTGEIRWKSTYNDTSVFFNNAANVITGMVPTETNFLTFGVENNAVATNYTIDNYKSKASATDQLLGVDDVNLVTTNMSLFPNPANNVITLTSDTSIKDITVFNNIGQLVLTKNSNFSTTNDLDISNLNSGLYIMNINSEDGRTQTKKFIKQ